MSQTPKRQTKTMWQQRAADTSAKRAKRNTGNTRSKRTTPAQPKAPRQPTQRMPNQGPKKGGNGKSGKRRQRSRGATKDKLPLRQRNKWLWLLKWFCLTSLIMVTLMFVVLATLIWYWGRDLPDANQLKNLELDQVTLVKSRDGKLIAEIYEERGRRTVVPLEKMGPLVPKAFIVAEDAEFYEHKGIDYFGLMRATLVNLRSGEKKQGASTITMQVVKRTLLTPEKSIKRKVKQMILARRLEEALSKDKILELYLNQIYLGHGRYGVQEASKFYFGKNVWELNPGEAAMLAGLPQAPGKLSPKVPEYVDAAKNRQVYVLQQMAAHNVVPEDEAKLWANKPIPVVKTPEPNLGDAPEWMQIVSEELETKLGKDKLRKVAGEVVTTLDVEFQEAARASLQKGLRSLDKRNDFGGVVKHIKEKSRRSYSKRLASKNKKKKKGANVYGLVDRVDDKKQELIVDLGTEKVIVAASKAKGRYNHKGQAPSKRFKAGDVVRVRLMDAPLEWKREFGYAELAPGAEGAVIVMDVRTREVLAMVGGYQMAPKSFNRATMARRQAGSTFKPFVYAAAVEAKTHTPATIRVDAPEVYDMVDDVWKPQNYKKGHYEGPVRLRYALAKSINTVAIRVTQEVGPGRVADVAHALGISSDLPEQPSIGLGSGEVSLVELTNAFASIGDGGRAKPARFMRQILGKEAPLEAGKQVITPQTAYVVANMMKSVVDYGTAGKARKLNLGVAGKTGTSNRSRDAWFIGLVGDYAIGVWVGFDDDRPIGRGGSGGSAALPVFVSIAESLKLEPLRLNRPDGIVEVMIDKASGLLAHPNAAADTKRSEVFIAGTEPSEMALDPALANPNDFQKNAYGDTPGGAQGDPGDYDDAPPEDDKP